MKSLIIILSTVITLTASAAGPAIKGLSSSQSANEYFQMGYDAALNGQYDIAVQNYTQAIEIDSNRVYFYYHRGMTHKALHEKAKAIADFKKCVAMKPLAEAYFELGLYKYNDGDMIGAKNNFEKARALRNNIEKIGYYLGAAYFHTSNYDSAESVLDQYTYLVKNNADAFFCLAKVKVKLHKYDEVTPMLKLAGLYNDYNDWTLHLKMYDIYKEMGDKENMFYHISMVIELGQTNPEYYSIRAKLYEERGENLNASIDLQNATAMSSK